MLKLSFIFLLIIQCLTGFSQIDTTEEILEFVIEEPIPINNKILNYSYKDFMDSTGLKFDSISAFKKLPWKIKEIYSFLINKKDIIYVAEELDLHKNVVTSTNEIGFKIHNDKKEIEAKSYDYSKNKYIKRPEPTFERIGGELVKFTPVQHPIMKLKKTSKDESLKFMPFVPLGVFRTLEKKETIQINNQEYECMIVEGRDTLLLDDWKYWMVINKPGLVVKAIKETGDNRITWLLKEIR